MKQIICVLTALNLTLPCQAFLEVEGFYWDFEPEATGYFTVSTFPGISLDVSQDLGLESSDSTQGFRGKLGGIGFSYFKLDLSGYTKASDNITIQNSTVSVPTEYTTTLEADMIEGYFTYTLDVDMLELGFILGGQYIDYSAAIISNVGSITSDEKTFIPFLGGHGAVNFHKYFSIRGSAKYSKIDIRDVITEYTNLECSLLFKPVEHIYAGAGYRYMKIEFEDSDVSIKVDFELGGPIVFAGISW